jgi:hypothetical protein
VTNITAEKPVAPFDGNVYFLNETSQGTFCMIFSFTFLRSNNTIISFHHVHAGAYAFDNINYAMKPEISET